MVPPLVPPTAQPSNSSPFTCEDTGHQAKKLQFPSGSCAIGGMQCGGKAGASWLKLTPSQSGTNVLSQGGQL